MRQSGYYPPGAEFDPRAPWNEDSGGCEEHNEFDEYCVDCDYYANLDEVEWRGDEDRAYDAATGK